MHRPVLLPVSFLLSLVATSCFPVSENTRTIDISKDYRVSTTPVGTPYLVATIDLNNKENSSLNVRVQKEQKCQQVESTTVDRTIITEKKLEGRAKLTTGVFWAASIAGAGMLVAGIAMDQPIMQEKSEDGTDSSSDKELTTAGGLIIVGAIGLALLVPAIANSANARDTEDHVGNVVISDPAGDPIVCSSKSAPSVKTILSKKTKDNSEERNITSETDYKGESHFSVSLIQKAFCPDNETDKYYLRYSNEKLDTTKEIHDLCQFKNAEKEKETARDHFDTNIVKVNSILDINPPSVEEAKALLKTLSPQTDEQTALLHDIEEKLAGTQLAEAEKSFKKGETASALYLLKSVDQARLTENQNKKYLELKVKLDKIIEKEADEEGIKEGFENSIALLTDEGAIYRVSLDSVEIRGGRVVAEYLVSSFVANVAFGNEKAGKDVLQLLFRADMQRLVVKNEEIKSIEIQLGTVFAKTDRYGNETGEKHVILAKASTSGNTLRKINLERASEKYNMLGFEAMCDWLKTFTTMYYVAPGY